MIVRLYHAMTTETRWECNPETWTERPHDYKAIADVEVEDYNEVFGLTNHIEHDWTTNRGVSMLVEGPQRSTSVGDVYEMEDGSALMVAGAGFEPCG